MTIYDQALQLAERGAQMDDELSQYDIAIRPLAGNDFGLTGHGWNEQVSATVGTGNTFENSAINARIATDRYIVVYGVHVASSWDTVATLRFTVGGAQTHQWDLQSVLASEPHRFGPEQRRLLVYPSPSTGLIDPVIVPPGSEVIMGHYVRGGSAVGVQTAEIVLLGFVAERASGGGGGLYAGPVMVRPAPAPFV